MSNTALITGASSGIGYELALVHAEKGGDLLLVARRADKLQALKTLVEQQYGVKAHTLAIDLANTAAPQTIFDYTQTHNLQIDVLINNAGFGGQGYYHKKPWTNDQAMIQVNILALAQLTHLFLPQMLERNAGRILNIASSAGLMPGGPLQTTYFASKAFVVSFSQGLAGELLGTNVTVTALCPGATATEFESRANLENTKLFKQSVFSAKTVALDGYKAMLQGKRVKLTALDFVTRISFALLPFVPSIISLKMVRMLQEEIQ